jgi:hypothetical protein
VMIVDNAVAAEPLVISRLVVKMDAMVKSGETSTDVDNDDSASMYQMKLPLWPSRSFINLLSILVELKMNGYIVGYML